MWFLFFYKYDVYFFNYFNRKLTRIVFNWNIFFLSVPHFFSSDFFSPFLSSFFKFTNQMHFLLVFFISYLCVCVCSLLCVRLMVSFSIQFSFLHEFGFLFLLTDVNFVFLFYFFSYYQKDFFRYFFLLLFWQIFMFFIHGDVWRKKEGSIKRDESKCEFSCELWVENENQRLIEKKAFSFLSVYV